MAVIRDALKEFYFVSPHWDDKSQRILGTVGFEYELAERAFDRLHQLCISHTDSAVAKWTIPEGDVAELAILARAFVDHAVRIKKLLRSTAIPNGKLWDSCELFFQSNRSLFALRDSLHHVDARIANGIGLDEKQPAHGDLSWKCITLPDKLDCFWIAFGPTVLGEFAGPIMSTSCTLRTPIDQIIYRAHGITADLGIAFINLGEFIGEAHTLFLDLLENQLKEQGLIRDESTEEKAGIGLHGRLRLEGLTVT